MEDEEILPANSDLKKYLQTLGYSDIETFKGLNDENTSKCAIPKNLPRKLIKEHVDKDVVEDIGAILSTQMLFEEDVSNIEVLLSNYAVTDNGMLKKMFQGTTAIVVMVLGLCMYWFLGAYALIFMSVFYSYRASDYLFKKHYSRNRIKNLIYVLESNYSLMKRTFRFIQENQEIVEANFPISVAENDNSHFILLKGLEKEFLKSERNIVQILCKATQSLVQKMPLYEYVESPEYYLYNTFNSIFAETTDLTKLHQFYMLIQSEFLLRVALSLIPNLQLSHENQIKYFSKIINTATLNLMKSENALSKKFKYVFLNGINPSKIKVKSRPPKPSVLKDNYSVELVSNIHDTSNMLQNLLIKARMLEDNFNVERLSDDIENELVTIQEDLVNCHKSISDCFILLKKCQSLNNCLMNAKVKEVKENKEAEVENGQSNCILVGYTDLDPKVDDEIFEAQFDCQSERDKYIDDDYDFEDRLKRKLEKEYSKKVLNELKARLVEKKKDWEVREANILKRKGITIEEEPNENHAQESSLSKSDDEKVMNAMVKDVELDDLSFLKATGETNWPLTHLKRCHVARKNGRIVSYSSREKNLSDIEKTNQEPLFNKEAEVDKMDEKVNFLLPDANFLASLNQARKGILKCNYEEELFCDSEENSVEEP